MAYLIVAGVLAGLVVGELVHQIEHRIQDAPIEIALSILTPYVAYLSAEAMQASGVLAVVVCGLYLGAQKLAFLFAQRALASVGGVGIDDLRLERAGVCHDRFAIALPVASHRQ